MKKSLLTAAALALLMTTAQAGRDITLKAKGNWSAYYTISDKGNPLCGMQTYWQNNRRALVAGAHIKYQSGGLVTIQMFKVGWRMPVGTEVKVNLAFDNSEQFPGVATSFIYKGDALLSLNVKEGTEADFLSLIEDAREFKISFPDGDEPTWVANMTGSREVSGAFKRCAYTLDANAPTQPTGKAAPTQPTGKPTQPAAKRDDGSV
jgi:hypothetical protein